MLDKVCALLIITFITAGCLRVQEDDNRGYVVKVGDMAPDFTAQLDDGTYFKLSENRGKVVMLQFTASWCGVCMKEMPFIEKEIWQEHKDNGLVVVGIDRDEPLEKLITFSKRTGITYPLALDPNADIFAKYALKEAGVTRNVIIDRDGKIIYLTRLYNREEFESMKAKIAGELEN